MTNIEVFVWGMGGCLAVDVVAASQYFHTTDGVFPSRYRRPMFYVVRLLLAIIGGGLAIAYGIDKPLLAANIGAATPLIIQAFAQSGAVFRPPTLPNGVLPSAAEPAPDDGQPQA
ncbi:hypothetical protein R70006_04549 [Paraburkholderia domus]|jgi:hypothetical protein|uniref:hypothetical protein n=1 Tax=Paraburkholderia domus TaxID=2793075 RepID=UPI0019131ADC|nr:hypothetical protein [Paraburkholderia domus]MBK5047143.1 hypothetical protein [Burkholderia sp. R-70006]CAE6784171.1 hypothetical protein R70006_04549 [Paraburkholderia domus]